MSSAMAWRAASLISCGAAKSGKPCDKFTAPCFIARRVISRITDSVNCSAFAESMRREICAIVESGAVIEPSQATKWRAQARAPRQHYLLRNLLRNLLLSSAGFVCRRLRGHAGLPINHPVELGVTQDDLHVFAGFSERNGFDELGNLFVVAFGFPGRNPVLSGVVRGRGSFGRTELLDKVRNVYHSQLDVVVGIEELVLHVANFDLPG